MKSLQHTLVVDADIARAAGPDPKNRPWTSGAKAAHDVLEAIRRSRGFNIAFDQTLRDEWTRQAGATARQWLARMADRGRVVIAPDLDAGWVERLIDGHLPPHDQPAARKDALLVALAVDPGDQRLLSNDTKARAKFARLPDPRVQAIHWVEASEKARQWLMDGAPDVYAWTLGHRETP